MPVSTWLPTDPAPASCQTELVVFALLSHNRHSARSFVLWRRRPRRLRPLPGLAGVFFRLYFQV